VAFRSRITLISVHNHIKPCIIPQTHSSYSQRFQTRSIHLAASRLINHVTASLSRDHVIMASKCLESHGP